MKYYIVKADSITGVNGNRFTEGARVREDKILNLKEMVEHGFVVEEGAEEKKGPKPTKPEVAKP